MTVVVHDNDFAGVCINKVTAGGVSDTVAVREGGVNGSYTLVLDSEPVDKVFIQAFVNEGNELFLHDFREGRHYGRGDGVHECPSCRTQCGRDVQHLVREFLAEENGQRPHF